MEIGPAVIALQDFLQSNHLLRSWHYKLDSFLLDECDGEADLFLSRDKGEMQLPQEWKQEDQIESVIAGFYDRQIYRDDKGYFFRYRRRSGNTTDLLLHVDQDWKSISLLCDETDTDGSFAFEYLAGIVPFCLLKKDILTLHGVLMEYKGEGIILSAASGVGKTTHARLWKKHRNAFVIDGDKSACYKKDGRWTGFGMPWCGSSGEYMNREVPIKAIVLIERSQTNQATRINAFAGFRRMMEHTIYPNWEEDKTACAVDLLGDLMEQVPVYILQCRPDAEAVEVLQAALYGDQ